MVERKDKFSISSDEELMFYLSSGEVLAFDELYTRYNKSMMMYFTRMLNFDKNLAEDALQDLFLKIAEFPEKFDCSRSFKTWIFSIASNTCKNFYRHKNIVTNSQIELYNTNTKVNESAFLNLANKIDGLEFRRMLEETLNELPPEKKEAFILKYQEEKTISEIAAIQDCPEGSVKSRLHYTLKILETKLNIFNPVIQ
ncbi:RNA polymerase sigma factor [Aurantibacillus circumpalustris]|uniref:RNA polymerase sigma factor n=1 Tax=Aurantibacillus circumpalustris TaxID=3036359 RepID=UPI00295A984E|nr:sigma-70 family RNA polymerase sigma factor [Aurantibacillus circumpalustris]